MFICHNEMFFVFLIFVFASFWIFVGKSLPWSFDYLSKIWYENNPQRKGSNDDIGYLAM